jgi:hydrogenase maturation protease
VNTKRVLIVGFGNPLVADDGAGPRVIELLSESGLPAGVRAEDGGSDSLCLASLWQGEDRVWLIDAVKAGGAPGTIHRLSHAQVMAETQRHATVHQLSLPESLRWLAITYPELGGVRYRLWGIEVERLGLEPGLSPAVAAAARTLVVEITRALTDLTDPD